MAARLQLPNARAKAKAANDALAKARAAHQKSAAAAAKATAAAAAAGAQVASAQRRITATNNAIDALIRNVYAQGPYSELAAILTATTPGEFAERLASLQSVARSQNATLAAYTVAKADLSLVKAQADAAQAAALQSKATASEALKTADEAARKASAAQRQVDTLVAKRSHALKVASAHRRQVAREYASLKAEQRRLRELERRSHPYNGVPSGELMWPIPGAALVQGVGPRIHPVYHYHSCHTGDDIRGAYGTPIHAAASGVVIFLVNHGAYGLHTIISHGGGIDTMYAHQSAVTVHVGETVHQGDVIGYVGATGWVSGPHLHFEVHVNGVPFDPMGWFGGTKAPVSCWNA
jgi:murein DD-endopeptidase MepM/ murein hydrolase activator NlpD